MIAARTAITADQVYAEAVSRFGEDHVWAKELGEVYESMHSMAARKKSGVFYTPPLVTSFMSRVALGQAIANLPPAEPGQVLRIVALDPACGCGIFLVEAAQRLAITYAERLVHVEPSGDLIFAVLPTVILRCVFGIEIDPVAAQLARLALSLETGGILTPESLERNVICGNPLAGDEPPALRALQEAAP